MIEYPPYVSESMDYFGLSGEILIKALEGSPYEVVPVFLPPTRGEYEFLGGKYPVSLYNNAIFFDYPELAFEYSLRVQYTFFYNSDYRKVEWESMEDLSGLSVGVLRVGENNRYRDMLNESGLIVSEVGRLDQLYRLLESGRLDLILAVDLSTQVILEQMFPGNTSIKKTDKTYRDILGGPWFYLPHPQAEGVREAFVAGRKRLIENGEYYAILEKYYTPWKVPDNWNEGIK